MRSPQFHIAPRATVPETVVEEIRRMVAGGTLVPGDQLPSVEALARQFGISRASVREALQALAAYGLIEIHHGRGSFVRGNGDASEQFRTWIREQRYALEELCELRIAVETTAARLAAVKASGEDLHVLQQAILETRSNPGDLDAVVACDTAFHQGITRAARNRLLQQALELTHDLLAEVRYRTLSLPGEVDHALAAHERILNAIQQQHPDAAAAAMREHLRAVEHDLGLDVP
jgi:GntR family transcriptional repressor for pyruvate dehydrogenase complex